VTTLAFLRGRVTGVASISLAAGGAGAAAGLAVLIYVAQGGLGAASGDTVALIGGTHEALGCLHRGMFTGCGSQVGPFPLMQYVPTAVLFKLGFDDVDVLQGLALINAAAFACMLGTAWFVMRRLGRPALGAALVLALIVSPLPWYAWTTFGESLGAFVCMLLVAAAVLRAQPYLLALALASAGQSKETALPFLIVLAIAALLWSPIDGRPLRRSHWVGLILGAAASLALTGAFNLLRFDQLTNAGYSDPITRTPTLALKLKFASSLWVAPNGGLALFWPLCAIVFATAALLAGAQALRGRAAERRVVGTGGVVLVCLAALTIGYADWYAPFGWIAWGPRLMLLLVPALLLFAIATLPGEFESVIRARERPAVLLRGFAALVALIAWVPQIGVLFRPSAMGGLFAADSVCPRQQPISQDPHYYYSCIIHWAWGRHWVLANAGTGLGDSPGAVLMALVWLTAVAVLLIASFRLAGAEARHGRAAR
jgi:hypothetical protein